MLNSLFAAIALQSTPVNTPPQMPTGEAMEQRIETLDARLFWDAFEGCTPADLEGVLKPEFTMLHDLGGLAAKDRADFIASLQEQCDARQPGGANEGYKNRRLAVPGSRVLRTMGDWGVLEEGAHVFFEWQMQPAGAQGTTALRSGSWVMVGGARYMHIWEWLPGEAGFRLKQSLSYDHGAAIPYPPQQ